MSDIDTNTYQNDEEIPEIKLMNPANNGILFNQMAIHRNSMRLTAAETKIAHMEETSRNTDKRLQNFIREYRAEQVSNGQSFIQLQDALNNIAELMKNEAVERKTAQDNINTSIKEMKDTLINLRGDTNQVVQDIKSINDTIDKHDKRIDKLERLRVYVYGGCLAIFILCMTLINWGEIRKLFTSNHESNTPHIIKVITDDKGKIIDAK